jgi:hypothetical protein
MVSRDRRPRHRAEPADSSHAIPGDGFGSLRDTISPGSDGLLDPESTNRFGYPETLRVGLPALRAEQLRRLASRRGVCPTTLVAHWVVERLDLEDPGFAPTPSVPLPTLPSTAPDRLDAPLTTLVPDRLDAPLTTLVPDRLDAPLTTPVPDRLDAPLTAPAPALASDRVPRAVPHQPRVPPPLIGPLEPTAAEEAEGPERGSVTPLFPSGAAPRPPEQPPGQARHRAPEPVTPLHSRRRR